MWMAFHISNVGLLATGQKAMVPCTPLGCLMLLRDHLGSLQGAEAVVVGRSNIVGKPMAQLLLGDSCTVTIAHSRTRDLPRCAGAPTFWWPRWAGRG
jgi:methylenetetrahydrofolate dehydrogenase (NADP+) / methenyltetrahydrofolate cyclohydrolase